MTTLCKWRGTFGPYGRERIGYGRVIRLGPEPEVTGPFVVARTDRTGERMKRIECRVPVSASDGRRSDAARVDGVPRAYVESAAFEFVLVDGLATKAA